MNIKNQEETMILTISYQIYEKQNFSCADKFANILDKIDPTYINTVSPEIRIYSPVPKEEVQSSKKRGLSILEMDDGTGIFKPFYVIRQVDVSFHEIPEDFSEVCSHILDLYGEDASSYRVFKEVYLKDPI